MAVVAAGVHRAVGGACEIEPGRLVDRQRIHIAAQQDSARGVAGGGAVEPGTFEQGDEPAGGHTITDRQRQAGQRGLQFVAGARAIIAKFGIGMDRPAKRDGRRLLGLRRLAPRRQQVEAHAMWTPIGTGLE